MTNPVRQHHVPQTYLKKFSFRRKTQFKIYTLDKITKKVFEANITDVAVEKNFYTINNSNDNYVWEKFYAQRIEPMMEDTISKVIKLTGNFLIQNNTHVLNNELKSKLADTMVYQLLRGKHSREIQEKILKDVAPGIIDEAKSIFVEKGNDELDKILQTYQISEDIFKLSAMQATLDAERINKIASFILRRCWVIYKIIGECEFITSDNPVMFINSSSLDATPFHNGIANNKTVILFPLSPKLMISIYSDDIYFGVLNQHNGRMFLIDSKKDKRFIVNINKKQLEQSHRQVFGNSYKILDELF